MSRIPRRRSQQHIRPRTAGLFIVFLLFISVGLAVAQGDDNQVSAVALFDQAQEIQEKGDLSGAVIIYEKALKILPEFPEAEYQRAAALLSLGKTDDAEKGFRRAVDLRPEWSLALTSLGSLLVQKEKYADAETALAKAIDIEPLNPPALVALADLRLRTKAPQGVLLDMLAKITALSSKANPTSSLWSVKAALEMALGKREAAKLSLAGAIGLDPNSRSALFLIADIALIEGDVERAKNVAAKIEKSGRSLDELRFLKASIAAREGSSEEALKRLDAISRPNAAAADLRRNIIANSSQNAAEVEKLLDADPKSSALLGRLCGLYRTADPAKALDYCRRASEAEPNNVSHAVGFAAALVQAKQYDAAANLLKKIIELVPDNWTAHANLATALFQLHRYSEAKAEYQWLTVKQPLVAGPYYFLAITHDRLTEFMDAMANYQEYLRLADPVANKLEIEKINLRLPTLQKDIKAGKGKKN